jgi:hypothetical protein
VPELSGSELLREWQRLMEAVVSAAGSIAGSPDLPRELVEPMQRQLELLREIIERERKLQQDLAGHVLGPFDAIFDLLEGSGHTLRRQAEALQSAGAALEETAALMKSQAELLEQTIANLRKPPELARAAGGIEPRPQRD